MSSQPVIRMLTFDNYDEDKDGSWLHLGDLQAYIEWLKPQYPSDAKTLDKLGTAIVSGIVKRDD